jgi:hypothetical protein
MDHDFQVVWPGLPTPDVFRAHVTHPSEELIPQALQPSAAALRCVCRVYIYSFTHFSRILPPERWKWLRLEPKTQTWAAVVLSSPASIHTPH